LCYRHRRHHLPAQCLALDLQAVSQYIPRSQHLRPSLRSTRRNRRSSSTWPCLRRSLRRHTFELSSYETACFREWREKQAAQIREREEAAKAKRNETVTRAEQAIDDYYRDYNEKKAKQIASNKFVLVQCDLLCAQCSCLNRIEEKHFLESLTDSLSQGTTWSRICDIIELQVSTIKCILAAVC